MDITKMLNTTATAVNRQKNTEETRWRGQSSPISNDEDQRKSEYRIHDTLPRRRSSGISFGDGKAPHRSRAPWDANGYAMPFDRSGDKQSLGLGRQIQTPLIHLARESESPRSPKHKLSDSQSTLDSYSSASTSSSHSRFSSTSTVGGGQGMGIMPSDSSPKLELNCPGSLYPQQLRPLGLVNARDIDSDSEAPSSFDHGITKAHKRTYSAPDPSGANPFHLYSNRVQHTPDSSFSSQQERDYNIESSPVSPGMMTPFSSQSAECMHDLTEPCTTGSPPRKVISHIFGRNKKCTRRIPKHIWVHICRKHYQRDRYRNNVEFAQRQCELVLQQLEFIHNWSEENKKKGDPLVLKGWTLTVRKREQERIDNERIDKERNEKKAGKADRPKKRLFSETNMGDKGGNDGTQSSVPHWLLLKCREGYSTDEMLDMVISLKEYMLRQKRSQFPDIEILADLPVTEEDEVAKPTPGKRPIRNHKRSKTLHVDTRTGPHAPIVLQHNNMLYWNYGNSPGFPVTVERQRVINEAPPYYRHSEVRYNETIARGFSNMAPALHRMDNIPYHPKVPHIQENYIEESSDGNGVFKAQEYGYNRGPRPGPGLRPSENTRMLTTPGASSLGPNSRLPHVRSVSAFTLPTPQFTFRVDESPPQPNFRQTYPECNSYPPLSTNNHSAIPSQGSLAPPTEPDCWPNYSYNASERPRHMRHQSTPNPAFSYSPQYATGNSQDQGHPGIISYLHHTPRSNIPMYDILQPGNSNLPNSKQC